MSYTKQTWETGDIITAEKLNHIENGVQDINMSYTKHTWENNEVITAEKLNNIEGGIENSGSGYKNITQLEIPITGISGPPESGELVVMYVSNRIYYDENDEQYIADVFEQTETDTLIIPFIDGYDTIVDLRGEFESAYVRLDGQNSSATGDIVLANSDYMTVSGEGTVNLVFTYSE